jgi:hypothetical protein
MKKGELVDLDGLLYGDPTWEQVVAFWKEDGDFCEEKYLVEAIKKYLRTEEQRKRLFEVDISIEEMLNGRYQGTARNCKVVQGIYDEWNAKLGFKAFGG